MPDQLSFIGRYEILEEIGRGGMATVYRANDPKLHRDVALKIIAPQLSIDRTFVQRFQREARLVARVDHPHIVSIYDSGEYDERPYIVMRLLKNGTLRQKVDRGRLAHPEVMRFLLQISDALHAAHQKGIIHRDIKPSNILFDQRDRAYISDFGIAKMVDSHTNLTGTRMVGTPAFMSPEQFQGTPLDGRTDQYSLAIVAYEALTGRPPFEGEMMTLAYKHIHEPVPPLIDFAPDTPAALVNLLERSLSKRPADRFDDMGTFFQALQQLSGVSTPGVAYPVQPTPPPISSPIEENYRAGLEALETHQYATARQLLATVFKQNPRYKEVGQKLHQAETALATQVRHSPANDSAGVPITQDATLYPSGPSQKRRWPLVFSLAALLVLLVGGGWYGSSSGFFDSFFDGGAGGVTIAEIAPTSTVTSTAAPTDVPATATSPPSATPTAEPSSTSEPSPTPQPNTPTSTPTPTTGATATATATPTPTPTATPGQQTGPATSGSGLPLTFDGAAFGTWVRGDEANGTLQQASNIARSGQAARLDYDFATSDNDYVVFLQTNAVSGQPNQIESWVYGDGSGHFLNVWVRDADGQTWQVPLGRVTHTGWQRMTGTIDPNQEWPWTHISGPRNDEVEYPLTLRGFVFDDLNDSSTGSGTIYLDDVRFLSGTITTGGTTAAATQAATSVATAATATPVSFSGDVGRILYTSGNTLLTTDPTWATPQEVGTAAQSSCSGTPSLVDGTTFSVSRGYFCNLSEGTTVCAAPNGSVELIFNGTFNDGFALTVRPVGSTENGEYIFDSKEFDLTEGLRWSPNSQTFLFVLGDTLYKGNINRTYQPLFSPVYNPIFSPDGSQILYRKPIGPGVNDIFVADASGENQRNVTNVSTVDKSCAVWVP